MTASIIADFVGIYTLGTDDGAEPTTGRILMSPRHLVLATDHERALIPVARIFDIRVGYVPSRAEEFFDDCVTIAYYRRERSATAIIGAGSHEIDRFTTVLFKATLNGATANMKHPSQSKRPVSIKLRSGTVAFEGPEDSFCIDLPSVVHFEKTERPGKDGENTVLEVHHLQDGTTVVTEISGLLSRKMNLLGRFLRLEYTQSIEAIQGMEVTDDELAVLADLRATNATSPDGPSDQPTGILTSLRDKDLVQQDGETVVLTPKGKRLLGQRLGTATG